MGDLLMNLPAVRALRQNYPKTWITLLVDATNAALLRGHPDIDEVLAIDAARLKKDLSYRLDVFRKVKAARFDMAVVSNPNKFFHALVFAAGIRHRVGHRRKWGFLLNHSTVPPLANDPRHEIDRNLGLLSPVSSVVWDGRIDIPIDAKAAERVAVRLNKDFPGAAPLVAVHAGTSNPAKRWSAEKFTALCDRLVGDEGMAVMLVGGPEEKAVALEIMSRVRVPVRDWTGDTTLAELVALLSHARVKLLVSSDSGPVHIAWMAGTPVVALYAKNVPGSDPRRWGPRDAASEVFHAPMEGMHCDAVQALARKVLAKAKK